MPPQAYILNTLSTLLEGRLNTDVQRQSIGLLSSGMFGRMVINPLKLSEDLDGRTILTFEGDETRGGSKGRLHRMLVRMDRKGVRSDFGTAMYCTLRAYFSCSSHRIYI